MFCLAARADKSKVLSFIVSFSVTAVEKNYISGSIRQKLMIETLKYLTLIYKLFYQAFYDAQISLG